MNMRFINGSTVYVRAAYHSAECAAAVDPCQGRWVARNPGAVWGDGFWINHLMVPWVNFDEVLDRRRVYDLARFKNEVLGLPTVLGEHVVTRAELEACCIARPMAQSRDDIPPAARGNLIAGIDWGGGGVSRTVLVIGHMERDFVFHVLRFERFTADEDPNHILDALASHCRHFGVRSIGADGGGNGQVFNRLLMDRLHCRVPLFALLYSSTDEAPRRDGVLLKWTVHRSATIGVLFGRVKKRTIVFPRLEESGTFLDEFACEIAEYDDINRTVRYAHPDTQPDDALHATNYSLLVGTHAFRSIQEVGYGG